MSEPRRGSARALDGLASLAWVDATNNVGAACKHASGVLLTLGTGHSLNNDSGV